MWSGNYLYPNFDLQNLQDRSLIQWVEGEILYIHEQFETWVKILQWNIHL